MENDYAKKIPGYTGYKPQFENEEDLQGYGQKDNRFFIPGYQGYVPKIKAENAFGQSFGKTSGASVGGTIQQGFIQTPEQKYQSIN